ncbi:S41 family peptidase [Pedobacter sp. PF22-3]|uniref:S41 family peptidase n=1 Tax=Pedobacter sp. PF22-3 TaxID=2994467 RepID=UPI002245E427|nr:S41 family peptidase [Pedobacter sp. PF22-3]MCX2492221.1 S41 family peptidase [Pedobacter sp. PF22-3]
MRYLSIFLAICLATSCALKQKQFSPDFSSSPDGVPQLTHQQMLADHDSLVSYIRQVSPVIYFNQEVRQIHFDHYAKLLRKKIKPGMDMGAYLFIVEQTFNAAQDGHSNRLGSWQLDIMKSNWIPNGLVTNIDTNTINYGYQYENYANKNFSAKLNLNLAYTNGEYYNLLPFTYKDQNYPAGMKVLSCNGMPVHKFVNKEITAISPLRWDRQYNRVYHERFYRPVQIFNQGQLKFVFEEDNEQKHQLTIGYKDTLQFTQKIKHPFGYNGEQEPLTTHYFEQEKIFYARMPLMIEAYGDSLAKKFSELTSGKPVKAIVLDIRGNGGGSDNTYANFLGKIMNDTLKQDVVVGRNFSPYNQKQFKVNTDSVKNKKGFSFEVNVATLNAPDMYFISIPNFKFVTPDSLNAGFKGKVYLLQDRFIYSSASNLSNLASKNDQLVSIGETPNLLGGLQTNPSILQLPYSKIIFRIEPQIDFTGAIKAADAFQNHVEYPVAYTIKELKERVTTEKPIYGRDFLYRSDPMFKKVLQLEQVNSSQR